MAILLPVIAKELFFHLYVPVSKVQLFGTSPVFLNLLAQVLRQEGQDFYISWQVKKIPASSRAQCLAHEYRVNLNINELEHFRDPVHFPKGISTLIQDPCPEKKPSYI